LFCPITNKPFTSSHDLLRYVGFSMIDTILLLLVLSINTPHLKVAHFADRTNQSWLQMETHLKAEMVCESQHLFCSLLVVYIFMLLPTCQCLPNYNGLLTMRWSIRKIIRVRPGIQSGVIIGYTNDLSKALVYYDTNFQEREKLDCYLVIL
jgi:hypothetical protein